jgi:pyridoxamine 5'-phosphate oxidase-like protein
VVVIDRVPASHADLLDRALPAALTTEMPDGRFQSTVVWFNHDDDHVLLNTMREFRKARNLAAASHALVMEPEEDQRWIELRGTALLEDEVALEHLDELTRLYMGRAPYFGRAVPTELAAFEHRFGSGSSQPPLPPDRSSSSAVGERPILCPSGGTGQAVRGRAGRSG